MSRVHCFSLEWYTPLIFGFCFSLCWRCVRSLPSYIVVRTSKLNFGGFIWSALGLGALAKLSIALVPLSILPWILVRSPGFILPGALSRSVLCLFVMTPWILWNMDHDFAHLTHEFGHVISNNNRLLHSGLDSGILIHHCSSLCCLC